MVERKPEGNTTSKRTTEERPHASPIPSSEWERYKEELADFPRKYPGDLGVKTSYGKIIRCWHDEDYDMIYVSDASGFLCTVLTPEHLWELIKINAQTRVRELFTNRTTNIAKDYEQYNRAIHEHENEMRRQRVQVQRQRELVRRGITLADLDLDLGLDISSPPDPPTEE
jgi:hypothetical protein